MNDKESTNGCLASHLGVLIPSLSEIIISATSVDLSASLSGQAAMTLPGEIAPAVVNIRASSAIVIPVRPLIS